MRGSFLDAEHLWIAVINQTVRDLARTEDNSVKIEDDAREWLFSTDIDVGSFN